MMCKTERIVTLMSCWFRESCAPLVKHTYTLSLIFFNNCIIVSICMFSHILDPSHGLNVMSVLDPAIGKTRFCVSFESHTLTQTSILIISSLNMLTRHLRTVQPSETTVSPPHSYPNTLSALLSSLKSSF